MLQVTTFRVFLSSSLLWFILLNSLLIVKSFQLFWRINFKKVSILKAYRANPLCFQIQVIVFRYDIGSFKHVILIIYENNRLLKLRLCSSSGSLESTIITSLVNCNIIFACTFFKLSLFSNVKQFNLTDIQYMVESLLLLTWLFSCMLCNSSFCLQVHKYFCWMCSRKVKLWIVVIQNSWFMLFMSKVVVSERTIFVQISQPLEYT